MPPDASLRTWNRDHRRRFDGAIPRPEGFLVWQVGASLVDLVIGRQLGKANDIDPNSSGAAELSGSTPGAPARAASLDALASTRRWRRATL